ncbi:MAG: hypothetical protein WB681_10510 [Candidatus Cybelea sp.]
MPESVRLKIAEEQRKQAERIEKYGYVRPPIWTHHAGQTFVAVGSRLLYHKWKTFQDFLFSYIGAVFAKDWFKNEQTLPIEDRHPLMQWYQVWFDFWAAHRSDVALGDINKIDDPPAQISALLAFAYDIYTLEHHSLLPQRLVERLQRKDHFQGARYEAFVAAALVRAGFGIALEDESERSSTHCEFIATYVRSGKAYSVEAKSRHRPGFLGYPGSLERLAEIDADVTSLLVAALRKNAVHDRLVFIDINVPPSEAHILKSGWFNRLGSQVKRLEQNPQTRSLPPAVVLFTNFPYHYMEAGDPLRGSSVVFTGFNVREFQVLAGGNDRAVRETFPEILALHDSLLRHSHPPPEVS